MKKPPFQIVVDCNGLFVNLADLRYVEGCVSAIVGSENMHSPFWVTRSDLLHELYDRSTILDLQYTPNVEFLRQIADEARHEMSFDLYVDGGIVPIGRLVNVRKEQYPE